MTTPAFDSWEESDMDKEWDESASGGSATYEDYERWLATGRKLASGHSNYHFKLGDWLVTGEQHFDFGTVPGYLLLHKITKNDGESGFKAEKIPNYWKDAAAVVDIPVPTLREYAYTARAWPKKKRFKELSYTHHSYAAPYERREEYLRACLVPGEKPRSIDWLWKFIRVEENEQKEIESSKYLRFMLPEDMFAKLKDLGKYYGTAIPDLVQKACVGVVGGYLEEQARKVSLEKYGVYDGKWPFYAPTEFNKVEEKKTKRYKKERKIKRELKFSERRSQGSKKAWQARRERMKPAGDAGPALKPVAIRRIGRAVA
jgi:hypothetical protein